MTKTKQRRRKRKSAAEQCGRAAFVTRIVPRPPTKNPAAKIRKISSPSFLALLASHRIASHRMALDVATASSFLDRSRCSSDQYVALLYELARVVREDLSEEVFAMLHADRCAVVVHVSRLAAATSAAAAECRAAAVVVSAMCDVGPAVFEALLRPEAELARWLLPLLRDQANAELAAAAARQQQQHEPDDGDAPAQQLEPPGDSSFEMLDATSLAGLLELLGLLGLLFPSLPASFLRTRPP